MINIKLTHLFISATIITNCLHGADAKRQERNFQTEISAVKKQKGPKDPFLHGLVGWATIGVATVGAAAQLAKSPSFAELVSRDIEDQIKAASAQPS